MYVITTDTKLSNDQAIFWLCHLLGLELPFLGVNPSCHQSCNSAGTGRVGPNHQYYGMMRHGFHAAVMYDAIAIRKRMLSKKQDHAAHAAPTDGARA